MPDDSPDGQDESLNVDDHSDDGQETVEHVFDENVEPIVD